MSRDDKLPAPAQVVLLAAFALFVELGWLALLADRPLGRGVAAVALCCALAAALIVCRRFRSARVRYASATVAGVAVLGGLLLSAGVPSHILLPQNWSELGDGVASGLRGASQVTLPYAGAGEWVRISILMIPAILLGLATVLAFWPVRRPRRGRGWALVVMVVAYAIATAWYAPSGQLARGVVLTVLICAWLWLPGLRRKPVAIALATAIAAGLVALPVAAATDREKPLLDYRSWQLGDHNAVRFQWTPSYGPFLYPQNGTKMLQVKSPRPLYWKAEVLDSFTGIGWERSSRTVLNAIESTRQSRAVSGIPRHALQRHPDWVQRVDVTVGALRSRRLIGSGIVTKVGGVQTRRLGADGTNQTRPDPLREGDSYSFDTYAPAPSTIALGKAGTAYPEGIQRFTKLDVPFDAVPTQVPGKPARDQLTELAVQPAASAEELDQERQILTGSRYLSMFRLARRVTEGERTPYAKVVALENYLKANYRYDQQVPAHDYPLPAFLDEDKAGYCQQFSGAMALMLRMVGVPSRVVAGFSTGETNGANNLFTVRDRDAHSWVEVYFPQIGWITFDPTPPAAPATRPDSAAGANGSAAFIGAGDQRRSGSGTTPGAKDNAKGGLGSSSGAFQAGSGSGQDSHGWLLLFLIPVVGGGLLTGLRRRRLVGEDPRPQLAELARVDARLGAASADGSTLLEVERRLGRVAGPAAGRYAEALRLHRFAPDPPPRPGSSQRRAMRKAIARKGGPIGRLGAWRLLPPGGPSRG
ncbi:hypothetical protein BH10ACT11_BH10ACT11_02270 [soil metagenome]